MGRLNIDILYQMFKDGVVYRVAPDAGPHGSPYKIGGLTQDQIAIKRQKERRKKSCRISIKYEGKVIRKSEKLKKNINVKIDQGN